MEVKTYHPLNRTIENSELWIVRVMQLLHLKNRKNAVRLLRGALHVVREEFTDEQNNLLARRLPVVVWLLFYMDDDSFPNRSGGSLDERFAHYCPDTFNPENNHRMSLNVILKVIQSFVDHPGIDVFLSDSVVAGHEMAEFVL